MGTMRVVNFPYEMFNDAMAFLEKAKKIDIDDKNDWLRWRYLRATILYSIACIESIVNGLIISTAKKQGNHKLIDQIKHGTNGYIGVYQKVKERYPQLHNKKMDLESTEWKYFDHINNIRNAITHYTEGTEIYNSDNPNGVTIQNAEKAIEMVRMMVKLLYKIGSHPVLPDWVNQTESVIIQ